MKVTCQSCQAKYTIADEKVNGRIAKIRCKKCGSTIVVDGTAPHSGEADDATGTAQETGDLWSVQIAEGDQRDLSVPQIAELWAAGTVTLDTYVWKPGFGDWQALEQVADLRSLLEGGARADEAAAASLMPASIAAPPGFPAAASPEPAATASAPPAVPALPRTQAVAAGTSSKTSAGSPLARGDARRAPGRTGATDLFAVGRGTEDDEVATSAPPKPTASPSTAPERPTGARNENSVLFSLSALTGGAPTAGAPAPAAAAKNNGNSTSESSVVADLKQLLDVNKPAAERNPKLDDIMNLGGGGIFAPALNAPPMAAPPIDFSSSADASAGGKKKAKTGLLMVVAALVVGAGGATIALRAGGEGSTSPQASASKPGAEAPAASADDKAAASAAPAATEAPTAAPAASIAAVVPGAIAPGTTTAEEKPVVRAAPKPKRTSEENEGAQAAAKPVSPFAPPPAPAPKPAGGGGGGGGGASDAEFDRAAALSTLGAAATAAQSCKKPDGPTGSGRISVTFSNSGSATTATVEGPPFAGTPVGGCIAAKFRGAHVPPFGGATVTVHKSFFIN